MRKVPVSRVAFNNRYNEVMCGLPTSSHKCGIMSLSPEADTARIMERERGRLHKLVYYNNTY